MQAKLGIVIPAFNEEGVVGQVVARCRQVAPAFGPFRIIVADNGSTDRTEQEARQAKAEVVSVPRRGYGAACLGGLDFLGEWPDIVLFLDADGSSRPEEMGLLLGPLQQREADLVLGQRAPDSPMTVPQRWGTRLAVTLVNLRWRSRYQDMGPYRAIDCLALNRLEMRDQTWGWTVEMQILACIHRLRVREVPVSWERRVAGVSKISGTVTGVTRAGARILWTVGRYALHPALGRGGS